MIYTLTLNPAVDYILSLPRLAVGETNCADTAAFRVGGKGINVSLVLAALGRPSVAGGLVAGFTGDLVEAALRKAGVPTDFIRLSEGNTRINVKLTANTETEIAGVGPDVPGDALAALAERLGVLRDGDTLVMAGSIPPGMSDDSYASLLSDLQGRDVRVVLDTTGEGLWCALPYRPFLIKPNRRELEALCQATLATDESVIAAAERLQAQGARNVLVSLGEDGAILLDEHGQVHRADAHRGRVRGTVGAGDSMVAGFLVGCESADGIPDYAYALRLATAAAGATTFADGLCDRAGVEALLGEPLRR